MRRVVILDAKRAPLCTSMGEKVPAEEGGDGSRKNPGAYANVTSDYLLSTVFTNIIAETGIDTDDLDDVIVGCVSQKGDQGGNLARLVSLASEIPEEVPAVTVNRLCASSLYAAMSAAEAIISGEIWQEESPKLILVGGAEHMGRHNMMEFAKPSSFACEAFLKYNIASINMGLTAEKLAEIYKISKDEQHEFAYNSHVKAVKAQDSCRFNEEIVPVDLGNGKVQGADIGPRKYASFDEAKKLFAKLPTPFKNKGTVTPAGSSLVSDGASALLIASEEYAQENGYEPMAYIKSWACAGVDPNLMGYGPVPSTEKALARAGLKLEDIALMELNEAFAAQSIAVVKYGWGLKNDDERINVNGGALALGHPLGASGARILTTLVHEMKKRNVKYGLASMCVGFGQGATLILERP